MHGRTASSCCTGVHKGGVLPVGLTDRPGEPLGRARRESDVHVIGHQAVRPDLDRGRAATLIQQTAVDHMIARLEEDRLTPVATLRHVVRDSGHDDAANARHRPHLSDID